jgi:putative FmdB family regulatory protein
MPVYEFACQACHKTFSKILTIAEHDKEPKIECPHCGSEKVEQRWADFYAITSKKSAA